MKPLDPVSVVRNVDRLVAIFDGWPYFHDSEVIQIHLERSGEGEYDGPDLWIQFHLFRGRKDASTASGFAWYDHHLATLRFGRVHDLDLRGFNRQNAIFDLRLQGAGRHREAPDLDVIRVDLVPSYGVGVSFLCTDVEVTSVEPGIPRFSVYSDG